MSIYRARNLVERFINKVKHGRCVATRYDKLAANYLAFVQLASICLWLRVNASTSWCPDSEVRIIALHTRLRTSESKGH